MNVNADILKLIFEATTLSYPYPADHTGISEFRRQANILSSICAAWRRVAIATPKIWGYISIYMNNSSNAVQEYWLLTLERVKFVPINISIHNISSQSATSLSVLTRMETLAINMLELHLKYAVDTRLFPESWLSCPVGTLRISVREYGKKVTFQSLKVGSFLGNTQSCFILGLPGIGADFSPINTVTNAPLLHLSLNYVDALDIKLIVRVFPALESLKLQNCSARWPKEITRALKLKLLMMDGYQDEYWTANMQFPVLEELSYHQKDGFPEGLQIFLASHPTIRTLSLTSARLEDLEMLAEYAGQVSSLTLRVESRHANRMAFIENPNVFPTLQVFAIIPGSTFISQSAFKRHLDVRCLPNHPPEGLTAGASSKVQQFHFTVLRKEKMIGRMYESEIYKEAVRKSMEILGYGECVYLAWAADRYEYVPVLNNVT